MLSAAGQRTDLPLDTQWAQRQRWEQQGYTLPPWDPPLPGVMTTLKQAGKAAGRAAKRAAKGQSVVASKEVAAERLAICNNCPTKRLRESDRRCQACTCFVDGKVHGAGEFCPDGHWAAVEVPRAKKPRAARAGRRKAKPPRPKTQRARKVLKPTPIPKPGQLWRSRHPDGLDDQPRLMAVGVVTCAARVRDELPHTVRSLQQAGFAIDRLFVDGGGESGLGIPATQHVPAIGPHGNTLLALRELTLRYRYADRFALFQDDVRAPANLAAYLAAQPLPERGWWNLFAHPGNERLGQRSGQRWFRSNQLGHGALGLVFSRAAAEALLCAPAMLAWERDNVPYPTQIDFAIARVLAAAGWTEYCHRPSLLTHTGRQSTLRYRKWPGRLALSFPGEHFDALSLLEPRKAA